MFWLRTILVFFREHNLPIVLCFGCEAVKYVCERGHFSLLLFDSILLL